MKKYEAPEITVEAMADMPSASCGGSIPLPDDEF